MPGTALILGASGRFGRHAAEAFWNAGWQVSNFDRRTGDLRAAARGKDVIVNGWNPPYPDWATKVPGLTRQVIAAAQASGATVILPGNVYGFGTEAPARLAQDTPQLAGNPLGRVRIATEAAYRASGVQTIVLRAGDFLDTEASGNWFDHVIAARIDKGKLVYPGRPDALHAWAYLPDLAEAAVQLAECRGDLGVYEDIPFPGYTMTGQQMADTIADGLGRPLLLTRMAWWPLLLARPVWPMARYLIEMRYLWSKPHHLDSTRFRQLLPGFRPTPCEVALKRALEFQIHPDQPMARRTVGVDQAA